MVMTLVAPGSAQLAAGGNRRVGLVALRTWVGMWLLVVVGAVAVAFDHGLALTLGSTPWFLLLLRLALLVGAVGWAFLFMDAWRLGQPLTLGLAHRRAAVGVNGVLCLSVAGALLFGAHVVGVQRDLMLTMFGSGQVTDAHHGRFNVLLLGGDSGAGRWGLRPDSLTVASIDEVTGRTVLVSLPRNMQNFPFAEGSVMAEQFPDGFDADYLNGVSTWAQDNTELFEGSEDPGVDATISAVEGITGLQINYWAMVNLQGFKDLVDAVGGITLNVRQAIPVGLPHDDFFHYIDPGTRKLSGFETLWYARARYDSDDYSRMARQKCVMNAMLQQVSPSVALRNFQSIAQASSELISTNVPASEVDTFLELALKARGQ
uniref:LCP family protein n=1 Tax=Aeromicrobium sp. REDSEA-S32_B7 TaxID=1811526 RepID=UPI000AC2B861